MLWNYIPNKPLEVGDEWVDFTANTIYGTTVSFYNLESVAGKYILLDFSSPGCIPCRNFKSASLKDISEIS